MFTVNKVCRIGNGAQVQVAQVPSQLAPRSVELGMGPNWEKFQLAQVPSQLAPRSGAQFQWAQVPSQLASRSVLVCT